MSTENRPQKRKGLRIVLFGILGLALLLGILAIPETIDHFQRQKES